MVEKLCKTIFNQTNKMIQDRPEKPKKIKLQLLVFDSRLFSKKYLVSTDEYVINEYKQTYFKLFFVPLPL